MIIFFNSFVIAHEFFDALPVHKFQKTKENEWREVCIDMDYSEDGPHHLRFVLMGRILPGRVVLLLNELS